MISLTIISPYCQCTVE